MTVQAAANVYHGERCFSGSDGEERVDFTYYYYLYPSQMRNEITQVYDSYNMSQDAIVVLIVVTGAKSVNKAKKSTSRAIINRDTYPIGPTCFRNHETLRQISSAST